MNPAFMVERNGRAFVLYAGLLDAAHEAGLKEIRTQLLQIPAEENGNVAICQSTVVTEKGVFTGLGDASPQNVARGMANCLIRLAETRSKARALRDAVNVGVLSLEEINGEDGPPARSNGAAPVRSAAGPEAAKKLPDQIGAAKNTLSAAMKKRGFTQGEITRHMKEAEAEADPMGMLQAVYDDVLSGAMVPDGQ